MQVSKEISGCGLTGFLHKKGKRFSGNLIVTSIANMHERGNGLGGGFAAYGIYPEYSDYYALHIMYEDNLAKRETESLLKENLYIAYEEVIPQRKNRFISNPPILKRYFVKPKSSFSPDDEIVKEVMKINLYVKGAFVFSSGKNMGVFKGVGFAEDIADFFKIDEYKGYIWIAHTRFPTNTPGWWGGAHPFSLLDWAIVHNGELSSYGINKRYLEMFGYHCCLLTDTEVVAYLLDLLIRRHKLPLEIACKILAPPFWNEIERMPEEERRLYTTLRVVYGSALLNGPFAILFSFKDGLAGLNDRIKLRPLVCAETNDMVFMASEECAIRAICKEKANIYVPKAGEPVIARLENVRN